jgi:hypothetical protein
MHGIYVFTKYINIIGVEEKLICSIQFRSSSFSWTSLMAYSEAKLNRNGDKASPYFRPF